MQKKPRSLVSVFIILALIIGAISYFRLLDNYELILLDLRFKARPIQKIDSQIAIVEIGNDALVNLRQWPLPRDYHATLIKILSECGARAIIFDALFSEPTKEDRLLAQATKEAGCVYYPYALSLERKRNGFWQTEKIDTPLLPALKKVARGTGFANVLTDSDGKRRRIPLFINYQGNHLSQVSLKAASDYLQIKPEEIKIFPKKFIQLGKFTRIPIDEEAATLVNLAGTWKDTFKHYSYYDILVTYAQEASPEKKLPAKLAQLEDKVCFVGLTATGTSDLHATSLEPVYPMIGLHANLFNSIVTKSFLRRLARLFNLGILYLLCFLNILLAVKTRPPLSILYRLGLLALFTGIGFLLFLFFGLWIDLFFPIVAYILVYLGSSVFRYIRELHTRELLEKELSIAHNIQRSFLKDPPQQLQGLDVAVEMGTARHVGGDLYDFVQLDNGRLGFCVGDVSGKGVPAALFMAQAISQFRHFASTSSTAAETLTRLNQEITRHSKSGLFVTLAYLIYEPAKAQISFASAGHLPPLVFRNTKGVEKIDVTEGIPLGLMQEASFSQKEVKLNRGEIVLLYSDGITEARNKKGQEFGEERIIQVFKDKQNLTSHQAIQALKHSLSAFVGRAPQHDDITLLALRSI